MVKERYDEAQTMPQTKVRTAIPNGDQQRWPVPLVLDQIS